MLSKMSMNAKRILIVKEELASTIYPEIIPTETLWVNSNLDIKLEIDGLTNCLVE